MTLATILILANLILTLWAVGNVKAGLISTPMAFACPILAIVIFGLEGEDEGDDFGDDEF